MQKTVTVIGGSGFIGRATVEMLARARMRVIVLCRNAERAKYLKPMGHVGQITLVSGDALNDEILESVIKPADAVINFVGILAETGGQRFDALQGVLPGKIGMLATKHDVTDVIHISAIGADANSPSVYARTKAAGEAGLHSAFPDGIILRPSIVFGPRDSFFNRFAGMAVKAPALPLPGGGSMRMQPVYVGDVVAAIEACVGIRKIKIKPRGKVFELGGPDIYSFRQLMEITLLQTRRRRLLLPVPLSLMSLGAVFAGLLPSPPVTVDQVKLLKMDNIVAKNALSLADMGITATSMDAILPSYLARFRPGGQFSR
ncbi:MAG: complex I NDUFA9 subunit family protein [Candidatus Puniceispirillum sp.]|uniref:complex I NDUFA9 subunit family protein n=1 Tax=Candidatus Puniceispirillum sp. TaxID=2026719 RepID=UPI001ECFFD00|nr:complex I NDUFA9 subunit family protein [Candidatus Puniceispirillum sp.]MBT6414656.1 complex I NDUFA9 subunit family protein [Candidatus Puniceispirillum sp.]